MLTTEKPINHFYDFISYPLSHVPAVYLYSGGPSTERSLTELASFVFLMSYLIIPCSTYVLYMLNFDSEQIIGPCLPL
jgi:hypothetical protein